MRSLALAVIAVAAGAGCVSEDAVVCTGLDGVDVLCPAGSRCVSDGSSAACETPMADQCGDGKVTGAEVCDDGNTDPGDGCSADCMSNETCGNGIVDTAAGEVCDDGNTFAHDGCDSSCQPELAEWIELTPGTPRTRQGAALAYDARHGDSIMFGGTPTDGMNTGALGDTWIWKSSWHQVRPLKSPSARSDAAIAYADPTGAVYLYGGMDSADQPLDDLWRWDGNVWTNLEPPGARPPRLGGARMVYDAHRQVLVLFGGLGPTLVSSAETWELDPVTEVWTQNPMPGPKARMDAAMTYDAADGYSLLFGGAYVDFRVGAMSAVFADTWMYEDGAWTQLDDGSGATSPPQTSSAAMGCNGAHVVLTTGAGTIPAGIQNYVWDATGRAWVASRDVDTVPFAAIAFEPPDRVLRFGHNSFGVKPQILTVDQGFEVAEWYDADGSGSAWHDATPVVYTRAGQGTVLDLGLAAPIMFGGVGGTTDDVATDISAPDATTATYALRDDVWVPAATDLSKPPPPRTGLGAAYDEATLETVMFGGLVGATGSSADTAPEPLGDTWTWQPRRPSGEWAAEQPAHAPSPRSDFAMTYDADRRVAVLFGGQDAAGTNAETWLWDGSARDWTQQTSASSPPPRVGAGLAYDRAHHDVILFGGRGSDGAALGDTWSLDGSGWVDVTPAATTTATGPSARVGAALAWDPARQRVVLFGGESQIAEQDTWEWDGTRWTQVETPPPPPRVRGVLLGTGDGVILYGGLPSFDATTGALGDLWLLRYDGVHRGESCRPDEDADGDHLVGCADPDCWLQCTPLCWPGSGSGCGSAAPADPFCGDGVCRMNDADVLCPDETCPPAMCGDGVCSPSGDCPGDCP